MFGKTNSHVVDASGGTLTVNAPSGAIVEITNGVKIRVKTANSAGQALFDGLESGVWNVTISKEGENPVTRAVVVTADYTAEIAFFSAWITVHYPVGSKCTLWQNGWSSAYVAGDQTGTWTFAVNDVGTYHVDALLGDDYVAQHDIAITDNGQEESVHLFFNDIPEFSYTGDCQVVDDADNVITKTKGNWKIRFLTSGVFTPIDRDVEVDLFLVGGGGGSGAEQGGGGGGGYTGTHKNCVLRKGVSHNITIGAGGAGAPGQKIDSYDGGVSSFDEISVNGGKGGASFHGINTTVDRFGGNGGSGGGKGGGQSGNTAGNGGSDGGNGYGGTTTYMHGAGQGTTTREFGEASGALYAGGGAGGDSTNVVAIGGHGGGGNEAQNGIPNTGGGAGGNVINTAAGFVGGAGIVIIRNTRFNNPIYKKFTYTGLYEVVNDNDESIGGGEANWKIRFLSSGTLTLMSDLSVDVFLVGGGGGGGSGAGGGGGGGYTLTKRSVRLLRGEIHDIVIGAGGTGGISDSNGTDGSASIAFHFTANGGKCGIGWANKKTSGFTDGDGREKGGDGGSGGGLGVSYNAASQYSRGGSDGSDGASHLTDYLGIGQHTTTREFGEPGSKLFAGGGGGGSGNNSDVVGGDGGGGNGGLYKIAGSNGTPNTGGGGGGSGAGQGLKGGDGGSGIVVIRNAR